MKDLTKGSPAKILISFALPVLIGSIFQQFYGIIDTKIVGQTLGVNALAAVGTTSPIMSLIIGFAIGICSGFTIIIAKYYGAHDYDEMRKSVAGTVVLAIGTAILLTVISLIFIKPLLVLLKTPDGIIDRAMRYISIIFAGMIFTMLYNMFAGILRALGDSKTPLIFLIISSGINIGLDYLFILGFKMDVEGAAFATIISQVISAGLCFLYIIKKCPELKLSKSDFKLNKYIIKELYIAGLAMGFMMSFVDIGSVILQGAINSLGDSIIAAHTAARKITGILFMPYGALTTAISTYCSQNLGAGKIDRIKKGIWRAVEISWVWSVFVVIFGYTALSPMALKWLLSSADAEIVSTAVYYLKINTPFYFVLAVLLMLRSSMQGFGKKVTPIVSSLIELMGKLLVTILLVPVFGYLGVCISEPIIWILCSIWLVWALLTDKTLKRWEIS